MAEVGGIFQSERMKQSSSGIGEWIDKGGLYSEKVSVRCREKAQGRLSIIVDDS